MREINKWLQNYPYRVSMDAWVFVFAVMVVLMIALATVSYQAIRAALANAFNSLRTD